MTHNIIKSLAALVLGALLLTSCGKDNKDNEALIGKWYNTSQSYEITIAGKENIPEGYIIYLSDILCVRYLKLE